jgi:hypothetical protein
LAAEGTFEPQQGLFDLPHDSRNLLQSVFFPKGDGFVNTMLAYGTFAAGFLIRADGVKFTAGSEVVSSQAQTAAA